MINYELLFNDFLEDKIPFMEFSRQIDDYIDHIDPGNLTLFFNYLVDNPFTTDNPDKLMLIYVYLFLLPNRLNRLELFQAGDNMYLSFLKSVIDSYPSDFREPALIIEQNINYSIYKRGHIYIILNYNDTDIVFKAPSELINKQVFCINCNDEITVDDSLELYPYGFYLIES